MKSITYSTIAPEHTQTKQKIIQPSRGYRKVTLSKRKWSLSNYMNLDFRSRNVCAQTKKDLHCSFIDYSQTIDSTNRLMGSSGGFSEYKRKDDEGIQKLPRPNSRGSHGRSVSHDSKLRSPIVHKTPPNPEQSIKDMSITVKTLTHRRRWQGAQTPQTHERKNDNGLRGNKSMISGKPKIGDFPWRNRKATFKQMELCIAPWKWQGPDYFISPDMEIIS